MVVCPRCSITHGIGDEFCGKCGSFLLTDEEEYFLKVETIETQLICPMCQDLYQKGNYCKKCGSLLRQIVTPQKTNRPPLEINWIKDCSKEWLELLKEKNELEICLKNLETQRNKISNDVFTLLSARYQERLKELLPLHQRIESELDSVRRRASEEIDLLEKELIPIQKRLEEFRFLYKETGITRADFFREKHELNRGIQWRAKNLKKCRQILSLLSRETGGNVICKGLTETLFRPFSLLMMCSLLILIGAGGDSLHQWYSQPDRVIAKEVVPPISTASSSHSPQTMFADQEIEKIKSLFETIKQANLQQNIGLFMTCLSRNFTNREKKRAEVLKTWSQFDYINLSYKLKKQMISGETADIRLEWLVRSSKKVGGKLEDNRIILDTILKKENGLWKVKKIRPVS